MYYYTVSDFCIIWEVLNRGERSEGREGKGIGERREERGGVWMKKIKGQ